MCGEKTLHVRKLSYMHVPHTYACKNVCTNIQKTHKNSHICTFNVICRHTHMHTHANILYTYIHAHTKFNKEKVPESLKQRH